MNRQSSRTIRVGFQGEPGAFSEEAVHALLGMDAEPVPFRDFRAVGAAVVDGDVDMGLLPVENTIAGSVGGAYDTLTELPLEVVAEVIRPIRPCLLGLSGSTLDGIRHALSHPVALAQCSRFLARHREITARVVHDTAGAAREVAEAGDPTAAAIASRHAGDRYGLVVLEPDIQDNDENRTRFFAVVRTGGRDGHRTPAAHHLPRRTDEGPQRKTALVMETADRPGALVEALAPFARHGVNLTRLESRPGPRPWTYRFILELTSADPDAEARALEEVRPRVEALRVLGRFVPATAA